MMNLNDSRVPAQIVTTGFEKQDTLIWGVHGPDDTTDSRYLKLAGPDNLKFADLSVLPGAFSSLAILNNLAAGRLRSYMLRLMRHTALMCQSWSLRGIMLDGLTLARRWTCLSTTTIDAHGLRALISCWLKLEDGLGRSHYRRLRSCRSLSSSLRLLVIMALICPTNAMTEVTSVTATALACLVTTQAHHFVSARDMCKFAAYLLAACIGGVLATYLRPLLRRCGRWIARRRHRIPVYRINMPPARPRRHRRRRPYPPHAHARSVPVNEFAEAAAREYERRRDEQTTNPADLEAHCGDRGSTEPTRASERGRLRRPGVSCTAPYLGAGCICHLCTGVSSLSTTNPGHACRRAMSRTLTARSCLRSSWSFCSSLVCDSCACAACGSSRPRRCSRPCCAFSSVESCCHLFWPARTTALDDKFQSGAVPTVMRDGACSLVC